MPTTKPASGAASSPRGATRLAWGAFVFLAVVLGATACWLRNRDILSDLYDYSSMITAAGKIEAGFKPYTDFRSTMQSACYVLPRLVEILAGRSYLGLTWGGLALSLAGATLGFLLLRRAFGALLAALLAGALTWAGFAQHVIIFYNPLGLLCLMVATFALARPPGRHAWRAPRTWLAIAALIVGGTTKLNFQALTLGFTGLLVLRAAVAGELTGRQLLGWWAALVGFGMVGPVGLELWWTGASPAQWYFNVVDLAEARVGFLRLALMPRSYLLPTYTLHHHVLFQPLHTVGLVLLAIVTATAWRRLERRDAAESTPGRRALARVTLLLLAAAAGVGGVLLTITNIEIITLTSLGVLVGTVAIAAAFDLAGDRRIRVLLGSAALLWMTVGGYAAWVGARVLYGRANLDRSTYVRLEHAPRALRYLEGVRLDADLYESLRLTAKELAAPGCNPRRVLFGPSLEWLERAYPQSIVRGMPVWYDLGTSLRKSDGPWLIGHLTRRHIDRIFVHPSWESWPEDFRAWLATNFRTVPIGRVVKLYERRGDLVAPAAPQSFAANNPLALLDHSGIQVHVRTTRVPADPAPGFHSSAWGEFYGRPGGWTWSWERPSRIVEGSLVATLGDREQRHRLNWRIVADPAGKRETLSSGDVYLSADEPELRAPFRVEPNGRTLDFEITTDDARSITAGWRGVRILDAADVADDPVPPGLAIKAAAKALARADGTTVWMRVAGGRTPASADEPLAVPFEAWTRGPEVSSPWRATVTLSPGDQPDAVAPVVMLLWYKSGRLELLDQFVPPVSDGDFEVRGRMPERGGWVGIVLRPVSPGHPLDRRVRVGAPRFDATK